MDGRNFECAQHLQFLAYKVYSVMQDFLHPHKQYPQLNEGRVRGIQQEVYDGDSLGYITFTRWKEGQIYSFCFLSGDTN